MKTALELYVSSIEEYEQKFELGLISFEVLKTTKKYWFEKAKEKEKEQIQEWYAKGWEEATKIGIEEAHKYQDLLNQNK